MNEVDEYILNAIKLGVWSGFYGPEEIQEMIGEILEDDADETFLRSTVEPEFEKKAVAESSWPSETDCDRLDRAFDMLNTKGIIALHNAGYTQSDGLDDVGEILHEKGRDGISGYCFYHGQDLERAIQGEGLLIAFGDLDDNTDGKVEIGTIVVQVLRELGFDIEWNGDPEKRINILNLDWKRRLTR